MIVSIIIVSWNTQGLLRDCLHSIYSHATRHRLEVIVVDNRSSDGSQDMVRTDFPEAILVENEMNEGFPKANNTGLRYATGEQVMMLNPDTVVHPGMMDRLCDYLAVHPTVGAVGPRTVDGSGRLQWDSARHFPTVWTEFTMHSGLYRLLPRSKWFGRYPMSYWDHNSTRPVEMVSGACLLVKRDVIERIGFLDDGYFMYHEDMDFCIRIHNAGYGLVFVHDALLTHYGGQSSKLLKAESLVRVARAYWYLFRKHGKPWEYHGVRWIAKAGALLRIAVWVALLPKHWHNRRTIQERLRGYCRIITST